MSLQDALQWRYATKKMNGQKVDQNKIDLIIDAAYWAPTSSGLQPFEVIAVSNPEVREKIKSVAFNQSQITDASHILVFAAWDKYTEERIEFIFNHMNKERGLPSEATTDYVNDLKQMLLTQTEEQQAAHAAKQAYIGFGMAIAEAALLQVDATPMEGFNNAELDAILELDKKGLKSTTILALGYREAENDWLVNLKKVRHPKEQFLTVID